MKLILVSGVFIKSADSRVDLLIVGDKMRRSKIEKEVRRLEAEIGVELVYALLRPRNSFTGSICMTNLFETSWTTRTRSFSRLRSYPHKP